jgi:alkylation response protein AidB-like acyl-CoA dehydrogenase
MPHLRAFIFPKLLTAIKGEKMGSYFTTEKHETLRKKVREFAEEEIRPRISEMEDLRSVDVKLSQLIARQGWIGATIDSSYGGMGAGHVAKTIIIEELSRISAAMGAMVQASQLGTAKIIRFGTEEQKRTWLPRIAAGQCLPTIAVTESGSGGHVLGMEATARRDGKDYVLNGRKVLVGNSEVGDLHGVVVRTGQGKNGLSAFLVEADRPGFSLGPHRPSMGLHGFGFGELIFEECRIPAANLLGNEGDGMAVAFSSSVLYGRPNLTAVSLGIHQAILEETVAFVKERRRYGNPLWALDTVKARLGQMKSRLMTARQLAYYAVYLLDRLESLGSLESGSSSTAKNGSLLGRNSDGQSCDAELMNAKLVNYEMVMESALAAMEIHGGIGLSTDRPIERYTRDAFHMFAPAGTSDVQRVRLAEFALGIEKGQWSGQGVEGLISDGRS